MLISEERFLSTVLLSPRKEHRLIVFENNALSKKLEKTHRVGSFKME